MIPRRVWEEVHLDSVSNMDRLFVGDSLVSYFFFSTTPQTQETSVSRIAVPAHIIARIRAGEQVSAEEITAAQEEEARRQQREASGKKVKPRKSAAPTPATPENEWIPQGHGNTASPARRSKRK